MAVIFLNPVPNVSYGKVLGSFPLNPALKSSQSLFRPHQWDGGGDLDAWATPAARAPMAAVSPVPHGMGKWHFANGHQENPTCLRLSLLRYSRERWLFPIAAWLKVISNERYQPVNIESRQNSYFSYDDHVLEIYTDLLGLLVLRPVNLQLNDSQMHKLWQPT